MEFSDEAMSGDIREWLPRVVRIGVSFVPDKVEPAIAKAFGIKDSFDFIVFMIIFDVERRQRRWNSMRWNWSFLIWFEKGNVESIVEVTHRHR